MKDPSGRKAYVVTGPTSGIGRGMALALAKGATLFLVARDHAKLGALAREIERAGGAGIPIVVDLSDLRAVPEAARSIARRAAAEGLSIVGVVNNAGLQQRRPTKTADGIDRTFAVNHLAAFAFTDALLPSLASGAVVVFLGSGTEDPSLKTATRFGFRGARLVSIADGARGVFAQGGSQVPGLDAYATSKLCNILSARGLARETAPERVRFLAFDPGLVPGTGLAGGEVGALQSFAWRFALPLIAHVMKGWSTPARAGRVVARLVKESSVSLASGTYVDDGGRPQPGSAAARDDALAERVVVETRAFLRTMSVPEAAGA